MAAEITHFGLDLVNVIDADGHFDQLPGIICRLGIEIILRQHAFIGVFRSLRTPGFASDVLFGAPFGQRPISAGREKG